VASVGRAAIFSMALRRVVRRHCIPPGSRLDGTDARLVWHFAIPASLASLVTLPCLWGVTALVARQPDGLAWVALFSVGHQVRLVVMQLPQLLNAVSFSVLSRLKGQGEAAGFRKVFWSNLALSMALTLLLVTCLALGLDWVLSLYGAAFVAGSVLVLVLLGAVLPEMLALSAYQLVQTSGRMWRSLWLIVLPRDGGYLLMAAVLLPFMGLVGAAWAYLIAQFTGLLTTLLVGRGGWVR
jgi:O-antigen/teichoic acid export membrane protein